MLDRQVEQLSSTHYSIPHWAKCISVRWNGNDILVRGRSRNPFQVLSDIPRTDDLLAHHAPSIESGEKRGAKNPLYIRFANCSSGDELVQFVRKFGPVWGEVLRLKTLSSGNQDILVRQRLPKLFHDHSVFKRAFELLLALRVEEGEQGTLEHLANLLIAFPGMDSKSKIGFGAEDTVQLIGNTGRQLTSGVPRLRLHKSELMRDVLLYWGHWGLTRLLNRYPPVLTFFRGQPVEAPVHRPEGIRPMLYFMLRREYLSDLKTSNVCTNPNCRAFFAVERQGAKYCSSTCSTLHRQREYWNRRGSRLRKRRMAASRSLGPKSAE